MPELLDVVELRVASGRWPAGTTGTIVETTEDGALVEIVAQEDGRTRDILSVPYDALSVLKVPEQQRLAICE